MIVFNYKKIINPDYYCFSEAMIEDWCANNCSGAWRIETITEPELTIKIFFEADDDEMFFLLGELT